MSRPADDGEFNAQILACIDRSLIFLGRDVKDSLYFQIQKRCDLEASQIASKPKLFVDCLANTLGASATAIVERLMVAEIRSFFGIPPSTGEKGLPEVIEEAKRKFLTC